MIDDPNQPEAAFVRIAAGIQAGDAAAEEEFVGIFQGRIRGFVIANTRDHDLAEELVQEVLWAVIQALREGRVQQTERLPAFVRGTARNLLNDRLRARSREKLEPITDETEFSRPAVEQRTFERNRAAQQAIGSLEPHERGVLLLSLVDGLNPEQIAARMGITYEAVRQRKSRALKRLAEILQPLSQTGGPRLLQVKGEIKDRP